MNSFGSQSTLKVGNKSYEIFRLSALEAKGLSLRRLPYSLRVLLENLLRQEDGKSVTADDIQFLAKWQASAEPAREIAFMPARVLMQDFTGVPAIVDLAAMRDAMKQLGGNPEKINPLQPAELVIDHSVQVDEFGTANAYSINAALEFQRNRERYAFLKWGQTAFRNFSAVPPGMGICHQVNLEYLARVVFVQEREGNTPAAYPDTLVGTDSHTTMINGLGVLGWGAGGIEAECAMLGQPVSMLIPVVVGVKLSGQLREGTTATDLVLTITEMLRKHGVVGKFVEFYGPGLRALSLADRATIANMALEYGATCGIFPIDEETLRYLRLTGRTAEQVALVEAYCREQGMFHAENTPQAEYSEHLALDLATVESSLAGPKRPQDRVVLSEAGESFRKALPSLIKPSNGAKAPATTSNGYTKNLQHGSVVIAAITSCTNTSNPSVLVAAGLLAKKAVEKGLSTEPWLKSCHRLPHPRRPYAVSGTVEVPSRRLRLHHLHRQFRPATPRSLARHRGKKSRSGLRSLRQPQLRSPRQLPHVATPGRRLRHRGPHRPRPAQRRTRHRQRWQARLPRRHLAHPAGSEASRRSLHRFRHVPEKLRRSLLRRCPLAIAQHPQRRNLHLGRRLHLHPPGPIFRRHVSHAVSSRRNHRSPRPGRPRR